MGQRQLKTIAVFLGVMMVIVTSLQFIATYKAGNPNWYFVVMVFGMLLVLFYTITNVGRKR